MSLTNTELATGLVSENISPVGGIPVILTIMTQHTGMHQVIKARLAMPQAGVREIKQNVFATCGNFLFFSVN